MNHYSIFKHIVNVYFLWFRQEKCFASQNWLNLNMTVERKNSLLTEINLRQNQDRSGRLHLAICLDWLGMGEERETRGQGERNQDRKRSTRCRHVTPCDLRGERAQTTPEKNFVALHNSSKYPLYPNCFKIILSLSHVYTRSHNNISKGPWKVLMLQNNLRFSVLLMVVGQGSVSME